VVEDKNEDDDQKRRSTHTQPHSQPHTQASGAEKSPLINTIDNGYRPVRYHPFKSNGFPALKKQTGPHENTYHSALDPDPHGLLIFFLPDPDP